MFRDEAQDHPVRLDAIEPHDVAKAYRVANLDFVAFVHEFWPLDFETHRGLQSYLLRRRGLERETTPRHYFQVYLIGLEAPRLRNVAGTRFPTYR
jgi:hypothetical protein